MHARVEAWRLNDRRQVVNRVSVIPFPTENDLLVCLHIPQRKNSKRYPRFLTAIRALLPILRLLANHRPKNSVRFASTSRESCFTSGDS